MIFRPHYMWEENNQFISKMNIAHSNPQPTPPPHKNIYPTSKNKGIDQILKKIKVNSNLLKMVSLY